MITITNGTPGLTHLEVTVNGTRFKVLDLADAKRKVLDVSVAMLPGDHNTVTLKSSGKPGSSASVLIADQSPQ